MEKGLFACRVKKFCAYKISNRKQKFCLRQKENPLILDLIGASHNYGTGWNFSIMRFFKNLFFSITQFFKIFFEDDKKYEVQIRVDDIKVFLDKKRFPLADLSRRGFVVKGKFQPEKPDQLYNADFLFFRGSREMVFPSRAKMVWHKKDQTGFEFFELSNDGKADLAYLIKSHQIQVKDEQGP